jgi:putative CocE/NonD family hydrolase
MLAILIMMSPIRLICRVATLAVLVLVFLHAAYAEDAVRVETDVSAAMRDNVKLAADIYHPGASGTFPVLLARTPFGKQKKITVEIAQKLAQRGYIVIVQDVRGRGESEGKFDPLFDDERDGYDSVEWAAGLPLSNGKVGMVLSSYGSSLQIFAAIAAPPHLVTFVAIQPAIGFGAHQLFFEGGAFRQLWAESLTVMLASDSYARMMRRFMADDSWFDRLLGHQPLGGFMDRLSVETLKTEGGSYFREWLENAPGSLYWDRVNLARRVPGIKVPGLYIGGWYDAFGPATAALFAAVQKNAGSEVARTKSQLIIGPWTHGGRSDVDFGPTASLDILDCQNQWLDYWLKGEHNEAMSHPAARVFVTGQNHWAGSPQWPLPDAQPYRLFLASKSSAQSSSGDGMLTSTDSPEGQLSQQQDTLDADPSNPVPTNGGELCCHSPYSAGVHNQNQLEKRRDVLVYTATALSKPLTIAGEPVVALHVTPDAPDIDLVAKLIDVSPDGKMWNVSDGALRLRYRNDTDQPEWLVPGKMYEVRIRLSPVAHSFLAGHSIRLQIAGSDFPNYSINLNSKESILEGTQGHLARTTVEHTSQFPSFLELPRLEHEPAPVNK